MVREPRNECGHNIPKLATTKILPILLGATFATRFQHDTFRDPGHGMDAKQQVADPASQHHLASIVSSVRNNSWPLRDCDDVQGAILLQRQLIAAVAHAHLDSDDTYLYFVCSDTKRTESAELLIHR